jgi:hypothetical protein
MRLTVTFLRWVKLSSTPSSKNSQPRPVTTFSTPGGRNSWQISAIISTPSGASPAAFSISVLPAHRAGAIFSAPSSTGAFQGM